MFDSRVAPNIPVVCSLVYDINCSRHDISTFFYLTTSNNIIFIFYRADVPLKLFSDLCSAREVQTVTFLCFSVSI